MDRNKIGFHVGGGGNKTGIGNFFAQIDSAGIPFSYKSADDVGAIVEAYQYTNADHQLILRWTDIGDHPNYSLHPQEAAVEYWDRMLTKIDEEVLALRNRVILESINEPRAKYDHDDPNYENMHPVKWLALFSSYLWEIVDAEGWKLGVLSFNNGEPEPEDWEMPEMLELLQTAADSDGRLSICLHEYSYSTEDIFDGYPHKVGRFQFLLEACRNHNIPYPDIHITEWGWNATSVPDPDTAMHHIEQASGLYNMYPCVKSLNIWYLGAGYGEIANQAQRLIAPVADFTVTWVYDGVYDLGPDGVPDGAPRVQYKRTYNVIPQDATDEQALQIFLEGFHRSKETSGGSFDDAMGGDLEDKTANLYGIPEDQHQIYLDWRDEHYPGTRVVFKDMPNA